MNKLVYITGGLHFEVTDSEMYGGIGSVGYSAQNYGGVENIEAFNDEFVERQISIMASMFKIPCEKIKLISKEEYDQQTGYDEDDGYMDEQE